MSVPETTDPREYRLDWQYEARCDIQSLMQSLGLTLHEAAKVVREVYNDR